jgi:hypothetical protein
MSFQWTPTKFFWFFYVSFLTFPYFTYYGMMSIAISPNIQVASIFTGSFYPLFNLFSGFIPRKVSHCFLLPSKLQIIMLSYINKLTQIMSCSANPCMVGLVLLDLSCDMDSLQADCVAIWWCGRSYQGFWATRSASQVFINHHFGFDPDFMGIVAAVLAAFTVFVFIYAYCIKTFNFQQREV